MDWQSWHDAYDRPDSVLAARLVAVKGLIRQALDGAPPGPLRVVSLCAGQGRDLIEALADHPRRADVRARLVELDPRNTARAEADAAAAGLGGQVEVVTGDAALTDHYRGMVPADLVIACGIFGNVSDVDIERTIDSCAELCATGGTVVWTRHRGGEADRAALICDWFEQRGYQRVWVSDPAVHQGIGAHRFTGTPRPLRPGRSMFAFIGYDVLNEGCDLDQEPAGP
ncbi:class I SAM-dependent methyltransferase family protein [Streptacidiphilus cavernicola]|uniref:Class I SAM-dependent methyltransferase family protein n=1 Tax=Streptacidiphilus cavernicola TaxID=3342716 RepID=A0ABV6W3H6_9ACTN